MLASAMCYNHGASISSFIECSPLTHSLSYYLDGLHFLDYPCSYICGSDIIKAIISFIFIKQLHQKVISLEDTAARSEGDYEQMRLELERTRVKLQELRYVTDDEHINISSEVRQREEIIEQLRNELTLNSRVIHRPMEAEIMLKEKSIHLEKTIKQREQQIQSLQQDHIELENIIRELQEENKLKKNNGIVMQDLEEEIEFLKDQIDNANKKNDELNEILETSRRCYEEFKNNADHVMRCDVSTIGKLKEEYKELERKHRDCLTTLTQQGDSNSQLMKEIKYLNEKIKSNDSQRLDYEKRVHSLSLEKAEALQRIENLKLQLSEASTAETILKDESDSWQNTIDNLSQETVLLNRAVDDLKDNVKVKDATIDKLNGQLVELKNIDEKNTKTIKDLEEKMSSMSHKQKTAENELKDKSQELEILELEMKSSKNQLDSLSEEMRKVSAEKRDIERSLKRKEDTYNQEIADKQESSQSLKTELAKINTILSNEKEINQRLSMENEKYMKDLTTMSMKISKYSNDLEDKMISIEELAERENRLQNHNQYLEGELAQVKLALDETTQELEHTRNSKNYKENALESCRNEAKRQQENNMSLVMKIEQRDQLLQRLTTETNKLKQKYQERQTENIRLNKENESLKLGVEESEIYVKELEQKFDNVMKKKDSTLDQLKAELMDSQNSYSQCYDTLLRKEEYLNRYQMMEKDQSVKMNESQKEVSRLQSDYDEIEGELNMMRAKYRACQEELNHKDELLAAIKNELHLQQQESYELQSERLVCQQELERWKDKYSELQNQLTRQIQEIEMLEDKLCEKDHTNDELQGKLQIANQKIENNDITIDQLKTDINLGKSTNNDRYNHFQSIITSLKNEIADRRQEQQLLEEKCANYKSQITKLKSDQEAAQQAISAARNEIEANNEKLKNKETECQHWIQQTQNAQYLNEEVKISLDSLEKEVTFAKQQLDAKETKLHSNAEIIIKLKAERNQNYKNFMECKSQLELMTKDRDELGRLYEEKNIKLRKFEQCMKDMTEEMSTVQVDVCNYTNRISKLESEVKYSALSEAKKQAQIDEMEVKISKLKAFHNHYKSQFKTTDNEVDNLNSLLLQQTRRCTELEDNLLKLKNEKDNLSMEKVKNEDKIVQFKTDLEYKTKELEKISADRDDKWRLVEDKQQKYQHENKKLKSYTKQVEEEIGICQKTIVDLQNHLEFKQDQLEVLNRKCESVENSLEKKNREVRQLEQKLTEVENEFRTYQSHRDSDSDRQSFLHKELEVLQVDLKDKVNKLMEVTIECTKYQTKCSNLEDQLKKMEKKMVKYESECKTLRSSFAGYNKEVSELRSQQHSQDDILEKTKSQYERFFNEFNVLKQEMKQEKKANSQFTTEIENLRTQLQGRIQHQRLLDEQIEEQEIIISQLQSEIMQERKKNEDLQRTEIQKERTIQHIENETETLSQSKYELQMKLKEKENLAAVRQQELETSNRKIQQLTETLIDKENKLKITEKRFQMSENEVQNLRANISRIEMIDELHAANPDRIECPLQCPLDINTHRQEMDRLRCQLYDMSDENYHLKIACQTKDEDIQRILKSKEVANCSVDKKKQNLEAEIESLQRTIKKLQYELEERDRLLLDHHDESIKKLTHRLTKFQNDEMEHEKKVKQLQNELNSRQDKLTVITSKCEKMSSEHSFLQGELKQSAEKIKILKNDKENIVENFNSWIQEQKVANEKLGDKIRDQNKIIQELRKEKSYLEREKIKLLNGLKQHENSQSFDADFANGTETENMRRRLHASETQFEKHIAEKCRIIEDYQEKTNDLNREIIDLKGQIFAFQNNHHKILRDLEHARNGAGDRHISKEDDNGSLDKQYWIKRVGELSEELQKTKEYWSNKIREISSNLDSPTASDETVSALSS